MERDSPTLAVRKINQKVLGGFKKDDPPNRHSPQFISVRQLRGLNSSCSFPLQFSTKFQAFKGPRLKQYYAFAPPSTFHVAPVT